MTNKRGNIMREDYFNPETYMIIDRITGEEVNIALFSEKASTAGWQKAYAKTVSEYIKCGDGKSVDLLAYIIENKEYNNILNGTQRELAKKAGVSLDVVTRTMRALQKKKLIKLVRSGCYMVSPKIMMNGNKSVGSIMFRLWGDLKGSK